MVRHNSYYWVGSSCSDGALLLPSLVPHWPSLSDLEQMVLVSLNALLYSMESTIPDSSVGVYYFANVSVSSWEFVHHYALVKRVHLLILEFALLIWSSINFHFLNSLISRMRLLKENSSLAALQQVLVPRLVLQLVVPFSHMSSQDQRPSGLSACFGESFSVAPLLHSLYPSWVKWKTMDSKALSLHQQVHLNSVIFKILLLTCLTFMVLWS